jgi:hypothetical protein
VARELDESLIIPRVTNPNPPHREGVGFCFVATLVLAANSSVTTLLYFFIYTDCCDSPTRPALATETGANVLQNTRLTNWHRRGIV